MSIKVATAIAILGIVVGLVMPLLVNFQIIEMTDTNTRRVWYAAAHASQNGGLLVFFLVLLFKQK